MPAIRLGEPGDRRRNEGLGPSDCNCDRTSKRSNAGTNGETYQGGTARDATAETKEPVLKGKRMTTATAKKKPKTKAGPVLSEPDPETLENPQNEPGNSGNSTKQPERPTIQRLVAWAAIYGLKVPMETAEKWDQELRDYVERVLKRFDSLSEAGSDRSLAQLPEWMSGWDTPSKSELDAAKSEGIGWRKVNPISDAKSENPYPMPLLLAQSWLAGTAETPGATTTVVAPTNTLETAALLAEAKSIDDSKPKAIEPDAMSVKPKPDVYTCTKRQKAELALVAKLGKLAPSLTEAEESYRGAQSIANGRKKAWDSLVEQRDAICNQLAAVAAGGDYQPDLFDEPDKVKAKSKPKEDSIPAPHPDVHQEGKPAPAVEALKDGGGDLKLVECLTAKGLKKLCGPDCQAEGLTAGKIDDLCSACEGSTLKDLERWQQKFPNWNRDIKGFGEKWVDRLQDAHSALRTKFPVPSAPTSEPEKAPDKPADPVVATDAPIASSAETPKPATEPGKPEAKPETAGTVLDPSTSAK